MKRPSLLSATQIQSLIAGRAISERLPWSTNDEAAIESYYKGVCDAVSRRLSARWDRWLPAGRVGLADPSRQDGSAPSALTGSAG